MSSVSPLIGLSTRVLLDPTEWERVAAEWHELFSRCHDATPFQSPEWLLSWLDVFSPRELVGIEVRDEEALIGFAPLLIYPRSSERVLAFAGGGVSDYLALLAEPGRELQVMEEVLRTALATPGWDLLDLTDQAANSVPLKYFPRRYVRQHETCFVTRLPESRDQLTRTFSERQRANLRNARSRLQRAGAGSVELATRDTAAEFLADLFRLHTNRWTEVGESGVLSDSATRQFYSRATSRLDVPGTVRIHRLRLDGRTIAVNYSLVYRDTCFCYLQGFDPEFAQLSPGTQLMFAVIEDATRLGLRRFDFLRGEEAYKMHWRPCPEHTHRIEVPRSEVAALVIRSDT